MGAQAGGGNAVKVLISGAFWHGSLEESYARAFESIGWNVARFDWERHQNDHPLAGMALTNKLLRSKIANRTGKWLNTAIQDAQPDLVLVVKGKMISPPTLIAIKQTLSDRPLVNFNPDSPWEPANSSRRLLESISVYDIHFTWSKQLLPKFIDAGAKKAEYLPFAYDPVLHQPLKGDLPPIQYDAIFVGTYSPERDLVLSSLEGCNIRIVGNGWKKAKYVPKDWILSEAVYGEDAVRVLALGACSVNLLRPQNRHSHNMRTFEIPATANAMLTTRSEEQAQWFQEGFEMECFATPEELLSKIKMLAGDPHHSRMIANNGYETVREETYAKRTRAMTSLLGFS